MGMAPPVPATIHKEPNLPSHLFNTARTAWGMESLTNPVDLVKGRCPKVPQGRGHRLIDDECPRLLTTAQAYGGGRARWSLTCWGGRKT